MKKTEKRRQQLLMMLSHSLAPITGESLAQTFNVTRQIIVNDIASLRADGYPIASTVKGYEIRNTPTQGILRTITCQHRSEDIRIELETILRFGGIIHNVAVTHDVYGELTAPLPIHTIADIDTFLIKQKASTNGLLSKLNNGLHTHLIEANTLEDMDAIIKALKELHMLASVNE